jgi:Spy/CpxP family protein refolding chaperone
MIRRAAVLLFVGLLTLAAQTAPTPAKGRRPGPPVAWWENPVANGLTLNDAQKEKINSIVREYRDRLVSKRQEVERAERELEGVFNAETVDFPHGRAVTDQLVKARGELTHEMVRMTLRLRAVLTTEQWRTLQDRNAVGRSGKGSRPGAAAKSHTYEVH